MNLLFRSYYLWSGVNHIKYGGCSGDGNNRNNKMLVIQEKGSSNWHCTLMPADTHSKHIDLHREWKKKKNLFRPCLLQVTSDLTSVGKINRIPTSLLSMYRITYWPLIPLSFSHFLLLSETVVCQKTVKRIEGNVLSGRASLWQVWRHIHVKNLLEQEGHEPLGTTA